MAKFQLAADLTFDAAFTATRAAVKAGDESAFDVFEQWQKERDAARKAAQGKITLKVSRGKVGTVSYGKGGMSIYGMGRWPITLYKSQAERLFSDEQVAEIRKFLASKPTTSWPADTVKDRATGKMIDRPAVVAVLAEQGEESAAAE